MEGERIKILFGLEAASGGALKHLLYLATHLDKDIFDLTVIFSPRSTEADQEMSKLKSFGITVVKIQMCRNISFLKDLMSILRITKYLYRNKFDIVHAHSSKAGVYFRIASWINRVPCVIYTPHCFFFQSKTGFKRKIFEFIESLLGSLTDKIIVSENEMKECVVANIVPSSKLININNAIKFDEYTEYDKEFALNSVGLSNGVTVIGAIARLVEQKDLLTLIKAARQLTNKTPNLYFLIAGSGELSRPLKSKIIEYGLETKVLLVGHQFEIGKIFSAIDIFVSTSLWEGLPYVILEAMWYKKPIVATNLGYGDILDDHESGYLIPPGDVNALCERLGTLIKDKQLCENFGERNHNKVKANFAFDEFVRLHEILYMGSCKHSTFKNHPII